MSDFVSWCRHLLLFQEVTSLHPPSFHRNNFSTCSTHFFFWGKADTPDSADMLDTGGKLDAHVHVSGAGVAIRTL